VRIGAVPSTAWNSFVVSGTRRQAGAGREQQAGSRGGRCYTGDPRPLGYLGTAVPTNDISDHAARRSVDLHQCGILAAQWLVQRLARGWRDRARRVDQKIEDQAMLIANALRDVIPLVREVFARPGKFFLGLYELEDAELEDILIANKNRIHVILSNTSATDGKWDTRNKAARKRLIDAGVDIQHRMFNNSTHIGHNKFVVHVPPNGGPRSVLTGSTNWTSTGVAGQPTMPC
jgi:hypothetical protein